MRLNYHPLTRKNLPALMESMRQAKQYLDKGQLSAEDLAAIVEQDPTPTKKYVGWIAKQFILLKDKLDLKQLGSYIEQFDNFLKRNKAKTKDINQFKTVDDLKSEVDILNASGANVTTKAKEDDVETIIDNEDLLVMSPHTHEASRKLGLTHFAFRSCKGGGKDSAWCTTFKSPDHFNEYYWDNNVTFYYIRVRSVELIEKLKEAFPKRWKNLVVTAIAVLSDGKQDAYDGLDKQLTSSELSTYKKIIGLE